MTGYKVDFDRWQENASLSRSVTRSTNTHCDNDKLHGWFRPVAKDCLTESICQKASKQTLRKGWVTGPILTNGKRMCYWVNMSEDKWTHTATMMGYRVNFERWQKDVLLSWYGWRTVNSHFDNHGLKDPFAPVAKECVNEAICRKTIKHTVRRW